MSSREHHFRARLVDLILTLSYFKRIPSVANPVDRDIVGFTHSWIKKLVC